ncbi:PKD-like family lipoprotein [Ohtaekwangia koreensis]|uniref:PKD-like family protein n=1 Tax=Ohtaekwangia koreensis TaxID=688867 RepID=A0A1T5J306_9BACT|nr:PKD-like family lipoprotein [Ohtaekwangia koreensis]SKC45672.1 PKD-like family protein [Ohtaekwangia koreensis]
MKTRISIICSVLACLLLATACYKDLGNYNYTPPEEPVVTGLEDTIYTAFVGDTLRIRPTVKHSLLNTDELTYQWKISFPYPPFEIIYQGPVLNEVFTLSPGIYNGLFTIVDHTNGMKYYYSFQVEGKTEFTKGTVILSEEGGVSEISFIKPDNTLLTRLYEAINSEKLPGKPLQILAVNRGWQPGNANLKNFWLLFGEGQESGVIVDVNTFIRSSYISENFYDKPASIAMGSLRTGISGVTSGVINGKFYRGSTNSDPSGSAYGKYGNEAAGDYTLAPSFIFVEFQYYIGYDTTKKRFVRFSNDGAYFGTDYVVIPIGSGFDPANVGLELVHMLYLNSASSMAYLKDNTGKIYEYNFFNSPNTFFANYRRVFKGSDLITANTKWAGSMLQLIYFSSGDKVYRYNPVNEELLPMEADFEGKDVSMVKLTTSGDTLVTGTQGNLYYLDVSTGKNGNVITRYQGIPGNPVDVVIRR